MRARVVLGALVEGFSRNDLLTYASAIAFQILTAIVPFLLFVLAVAGLLHDHSVWRQHLAPAIRANVPPSLFAAIDNAATTVSHQGVLWGTVGGVLTLWQVSGATRAVMGVLARIYRGRATRSFLKRYTISFVLAIEVSATFILAAGCLLFAPFFWTEHHDLASRVIAGLVRWPCVLALLFFAAGLLIRHAPGRAQTVPWVSLGAAIITGSWLIASGLFYVYLNDIASYETVFGSLAVVIVAMAYLYVSTVTFLFGAQLDAIIRSHATGDHGGPAPDGGRGARKGGSSPADH